MVTFSHELYPFTGTFRKVNGFNVHLLDEGHGDTVLMLHGNPTWSFFFRNLVLGLRDRYRVIAPDHIGCGLSEKPDASGERSPSSRAGESFPTAAVRSRKSRIRLACARHTNGCGRSRGSY